VLDGIIYGGLIGTENYQGMSAKGVETGFDDVLEERFSLQIEELFWAPQAGGFAGC
jgi:hypothetical protein